MNSGYHLMEMQVPEKPGFDVKQDIVVPGLEFTGHLLKGR